MQTWPRVAVIGGGVSGLATARFLRDGTHRPVPDVTLVEAGPRLGGKVLTRSLDGLPVDTGPDAVLTRVPALRSLIADLALGDHVVAPAPLGVYLWSRGKLRRLPPGTFFGVPDRLLPLLRSRLLSPRGLLRAGFDLVLPQRELSADPTVAELLEPRFGAEVLDRLVEPLIGGVHAGRADQLSAASAVPDVAALVGANRSVYLAIRRRRRVASAAPALVSFDGGLNRLVTALTETLDGTEILTGLPVTALERTSDGLRLAFDSHRTVDADAAVLATPAHVTADLLEPLVPAAAAELRAIPYVDVATVTVAYPRDAIGIPLDATGFLVPPAEGRLLVGCTWLSVKWPHLADGRFVFIKAMVGRARDQRWTGLDDSQLVQQVHAELAAAMRIAVHPAQAIVQRWPRALPQYTVGHRERLARIDAALAAVPGLYLAGAAYRGAGVASCVAQAQVTAGAVVDWLAAPTAAS